MATYYEGLLKNLDYLKLKHLKLHLDQTLNQANIGDKSIVDILYELTTHEVQMKEASMKIAMVKTAGFPHQKGLDAFDFEFQPSINKQQILDLASLRFIGQKENIVFMGPSGVGKSHLATAIGIIAATQRTSTYFIKCHDLIMNLKKAQAENRLENRLKHYSKYRLLIIDEIGYLPIDSEDAKLFFQLIDRRYEKKSTIFTTNSNFKDWSKIFQDPKIANAIVDRVLHHAKVINIVGDSYRLKHHFEEQE